MTSCCLVVADHMVATLVSAGQGAHAGLASLLLQFLM